MVKLTIPSFYCYYFHFHATFIVLFCLTELHGLNVIGNTNTVDHLYRRTERSVHAFENLIPSDYNIHELPPRWEDKTPTGVNFSALIMGIRDIREISEELSIEMNLYLKWEDTRFSKFVETMKTKFVVLKPELLMAIWHPDIFFENMKKVSQPVIISKPASLRIYNDSSLRYSSRIAITLACNMQFEYYPSDIQRCNIDLKSYAYNENQVRLFWNKQGAQFGQEVTVSNFYVGLGAPTTFWFKSISGTFSGLRFTIILKRMLSYHIIQTYIPSTLLVLVSWLSFLVPAESTPGRMAICVTCLLTLIAMFAAIRQLVPNVAYVKALDIWMVACIFFVFMVLAEFTIILKLLSIKRDKVLMPVEKVQESIELKDPVMSTTGSSRQNKGNGSKGQVQQNESQFGFEIVYTKVVAKIEQQAPIVIPVLFLLFNIIYWSWLLSADQEHKQKT